MPQRTFRIFLSNNTDHCLVRVRHHLDGGQWTGAAWTPPEVIPPRTEKGWQSESAGIATGTAGYVQYRPRVLPGPLLGGGTGDPCTQPEMAELITINWSNPFVGTPLSAKPATKAGAGVSVDSDFTASRFDVTPSGFDNIGRRYEHDLFSLIAQVPWAPFIVLSMLGVIEHAQQHFTFRDKNSVGQSLALDYPPSNGIARLCAAAGSPGVRTALRMP